MQLIEGLLHAARQYCADVEIRLQGEYQRLHEAGGATLPLAEGKWSYTQKAYAIFPRYLALAAIRHEVERFSPSDFASLNEARATLALAGETAQTQLTKHNNPNAIYADRQERGYFSDFVWKIDEVQLSQQARLPLIRTLGAAEHAAMHHALAQRWGKWYGGMSDRPVSEAVTLHSAAMDQPGSYQHLRDALHDAGVQTLYELREHGDGRELALELAEFTYDGAEGSWTDAQYDWLVYASHEQSITFCSDHLIAAMRSKLREFDRWIYKGWDLSAYA